MPNVSRRAARWALAALALLIAFEKRAELARILAVFLMAAAFTLLLLPLCAALERRGLSPSGAALCSVGAFLMLALLLVSAFLPYLVSHTIALIRRVTPTMSALLARGGALLAQLGLQAEPRGELSDLLAGSMSALTALLARTGMSAAARAGQVAFALVIAYYLLRERRLLGDHLLLLVPLQSRAAFLRALLGCKNAVLGYLSGVLKTSLFVGGATFLGLALLGVRDAPLLSLFMGVLEVLPYIGPVLAAAPIVLAALGQSAARALAALALVVLVQQVEGNFVSPYFTASATSVHPLTALVSVFVLGSLMGLWGILLAVPLVVTARSVLWSARQARLLREGAP